MRSSSIQPLILICIIIARLFLLPAIGFFVVKAAANFGFLPLDPLFQYVLVMQYAMPPAMNISKLFHTCSSWELLNCKNFTVKFSLWQNCQTPLSR